MESIEPFRREDDGYYTDIQEDLAPYGEISRLNTADQAEIYRIKRQLESMPKIMRLIPLVGRAAHLRHQMDELQRHINSRNRYWIYPQN